MHNFFSKITFSTLLILISGISLACVSVEPTISGTPRPSSSPSPSPEPYQILITASPMPSDSVGIPIENADHYSNYLSIGSMRIYEYENSTLLDGVCVNSFSQSLKGQLTIKFYDDNNRLCGEGLIYTLNDNIYLTGNNNIYSEIKTDISVKNYSFIIEASSTFEPAENETND